MLFKFIASSLILTFSLGQFLGQEGYTIIPEEMNRMTVSAYNSLPEQTDDTPCIGAQGTDICELYKYGENICAANFVPIGTMLHVEGLGSCIVRDRMNGRYYYRVDWYMGDDREAAIEFGIKRLMISKYNFIEDL